MTTIYEGNAVIYCERALCTTNGKTAHGLLRRSERFRIVAVVDSTVSGKCAGELVPHVTFDVPVVDTINAAILLGERADTPITDLIVGLAPDGGLLPSFARAHLSEAIAKGLHIESGLHQFLSDDAVLSALAKEHGVALRDLRKPPDTHHFFSGKIETVTCPRLAVLGTDSAVGKRTTAWMLVDAYRNKGKTAELVGTGQTARLQGAKYGVVFDSLINDFVSGEIEHAVYSAWQGSHPDVLVVEGQGSLMNPAYPGGLEILAAARPACIVMQHDPTRVDYDGFSGYPLHDIKKQIVALEMVSDKKVVAITLNTAGMRDDEVLDACNRLSDRTGLTTVAPFTHGVVPVLDAAEPYLQAWSAKKRAC